MLNEIAETWGFFLNDDQVALMLSGMGSSVDVFRMVRCYRCCLTLLSVLPTELVSTPFAYKRQITLSASVKL